MKWLSRIAVVAAVLSLLLMIRSTMVEDRLEAVYGSAHLELYSGNGQLMASATLIGDYGTHPGWFPVIWHPHQRLSMWPSYDAAFGYAVGGGSRWNGRAWAYGAGVPHCCVVLLLLLVPAGRYVVWRVRGRVTPGPQAGFELKPA